MAVIERIGRPESRPYVVAWGRLTEEDEGRLLARVLTSRHVDVTVDLCEIEDLRARPAARRTDEDRIGAFGSRRLGTTPTRGARESRRTRSECAAGPSRWVPSMTWRQPRSEPPSRRYSSLPRRRRSPPRSAVSSRVGPRRSASGSRSGIGMSVPSQADCLPSSGWRVRPDYLVNSNVAATLIARAFAPRRR
jgi:hypothetical protein